MRQRHAATLFLVACVGDEDGSDDGTDTGDGDDCLSTTRVEYDDDVGVRPRR